MSTPRQSEREEFEAWYVADALRQVPDLDITVEDMRNLRNGDNYGPDRVMLQGKWEGWQARSASLRREEQGEARVPERTPMDRFENAIREVGVVAACEWFGYRYDSEFTKETARVLAERALQSNGEQQ